MHDTNKFTAPFLILSALSALSLGPSASSCRGAQQANYCCSGAILRKDHSSKSFGADVLICCKDDTPSVLLGPQDRTTCSNGSPIPLTQASSVGAADATPTPALEGAAATNGAVTAVVGSGEAAVTASMSGMETQTSANSVIGASVPLIGCILVTGGAAMLALV